MTAQPIDRLPPSLIYESAELDALREAQNYYAWLAALSTPYLGQRVLEIGAGHGSFASAVLDIAPAIALTLVEPATNNLPVLYERFAGDARVSIWPGYFSGLRVGALPMDSVLLFNVIEHVEDPRQLLHAARASLRPGGKLVLLVPAGPSLYGSLDVAFGHNLRFSAASLREMIEDAGYAMVEMRHVNSLGVVPWFLLNRVMQERTLSPWMVKVYDRLAIPVLSRLERAWSPPFGQSLLAVAEPRL